jgi:glycosyltransferase involved in cell wall biosynthesis
MNKKLAIVIPAFKSDYFECTLESLLNQTCKEFKLYIGDDSSPEDLKIIVDKFSSKLDINYVRFENNLGSTDLVEQWHRCIKLTENEEWIWLFSDDDILDPKCVESFFEYIGNNIDIELVHFNVKVIDNLGLEKLDHIVTKFPKILSSKLFFEKKIKGELLSFAIEYVFKRNVYENESGFINFDLAWCSDDATWIKFAMKNGIHTIEQPFVYWRYSGINISSLINNNSILYRKLNSKSNYFIWAKSFFLKYKIQTNINYFDLTRWFLIDINANRQLLLTKRILISFIYTYKLFGILGGLISFFYVLYFEIKKVIIRIIKINFLM